MTSHTFTRQELYDLVWSEPMIKLAAKYGISGNGLAKACRKAEIPVPERGYWNRIQAGQNAKKSPLPKAGPNTPDRVTIDPPTPRPAPPPPPPVPESVRESIEAERRAAMPIAVFATLSSPHRIIAAWLEQDRRERRERRHEPWFGRSEPIDGSDLAKRRLRILSALFKALEGRGYKLAVGEAPYSRQVQIVVKEEKLSIGIEERIRQVRRPITDEERTDRSRYFSANQRWAQEKVPTGELVLTISAAGTYGLKLQWTDAPDAPLESKLGEVLPQIAGMIEELRLQRIAEAEARERQWKAEQERYRQEMDRKREIVRFRQLLQHCQDWRAAADIRSLVAAVEASSLAADPENFSAWRSWALSHADRIDPLQDADIFDHHVDDRDVYALRD